MVDGIRTAPVTGRKTPNETADFPMGFATVINNAADTPISAVTVKNVYLDEVLVAQGATPEAGATTPVLIDSATPDGQNVQLVLSGGVSGNVYKILLKITTANGRIYEGSANVRVDDA